MGGISHLDPRVWGTPTYQETNMKLNIKSPIKVKITVDDEAKKKAVEAKDATVAWSKLMGRKIKASAQAIKETK